MYKFIISILLFSVSFSLDTDWKVHGNHEISLNSVIIEFKDSYAPSLGVESPLNFSELSNLKALDQINNFKNLEPLFKSS